MSDYVYSAIVLVLACIVRYYASKPYVCVGALAKTRDGKES